MNIWFETKKNKLHLVDHPKYLIPNSITCIWGYSWNSFAPRPSVCLPACHPWLMWSHTLNVNSLENIETFQLPKSKSCQVIVLFSSFFPVLLEFHFLHFIYYYFLELSFVIVLFLCLFRLSFFSSICLPVAFPRWFLFMLCQNNHLVINTGNEWNCKHGWNTHSDINTNRLRWENAY